jgi:predicted Zn-dependent peptidase
MLQTFKLSNGLQVVLYTMNSLRSLHLRLSVKGGSLVEGKEKNGVAHFMEHMLVQGIPSFPNVHLLSSFAEGLAGNYNAYTSQLTVSFTMTVPFPHAKEAVRVASEVFFAPLFPDDVIEKERRAVLNEIKQDRDSRWYKFQEFYRTTRFTEDSPLMLRTAGTPTIVEQLTRQDFVEYWENYFHPKNAYLFLIGNLSVQDAKAMLEEYFGIYKSKKTFSGYPVINRSHLAGRTVALRNDKELQVNYVDFTFPSLSLEDDIMARVTQNIALIILGRLRTSRLFQLLRYEKGLVYGVSATDAQWPGLGYVNISSEVSSEHVEEVIQLITQELKTFREHGPLEKELDFTKNYLANSWLMAFDNPSSIADWISGEFLWKDKIRLPEEYITLLDKIQVKDLFAIMRDQWDMEKLQLSIQGPIEDSTELQKKYSEIIDVLR